MASESAPLATLPPVHERPIKNTICLFDVDNTLTPARGALAPSMLSLLTRLRTQMPIGFVGGSNLAKQQEQLGSASLSALSMFDYCFPENGLEAYRMGQPLASQSFIKWLGEEKYKKLVNWLLRYMSELDVPIKRGTFIEFRAGMINVSPIGRNASTQERNEYEKFDLASGVRKKMVEDLKAAFPDFGLTFSIGGQISFDVFPTGWDKTYCLQHLEAEAKRTDGQAVEFTNIHFFGDKTYKGGNDYEIYEDKRTIGHSVNSPADTETVLKKVFPFLET